MVRAWSLIGIWGVVGIAGWLPPARAEDPTSDVGTLRKQIESLQLELRAAEKAEEKTRKVSQIGAARASGGRQLPLVVRLYDLSDLFTVAPSYAAQPQSPWCAGERPFFAQPPATASGSAIGGMGGMGGMGGFGGGVFRVSEQSVARSVGTPVAGPWAALRQNVSLAGDHSSASPRTSLDSLVEAITNSIDPDSWDHNGGKGTISPLGTSLLISADEPTHEQIEQLLDLFRQRWGSLRTVTLRAYWLWLGDAQLRDLVHERGSQLASAAPAYGDVDDSRLLDALNGANDSGLGGYRAAITCYNGQTVHVTSSRERLAVAEVSADRLVSDDPPPSPVLRIQPTTVTVFEGVALQVTPVVTHGGQVVVLDLHSRVTRPVAADEAPRGRAAESPPLLAALDRTVLATQRLSTTVRLPVDRTVLIGGMSGEGVPNPDAPSLYLFVKAQVQELRDDRAPSPSLERPAEEAAPPAGAAASGDGAAGSEPAAAD